MGDLSRNFSRGEFQCTGCRGRECPHGYNRGHGIATCDAELLAILEDVRTHFGGRAVTVTSGFRCPERNRAVGGAPGGQHPRGTAADIVVKGVKPSDVFAYLDPRHDGGLGNYAGFTHIDVRPYRVRF